MLTINVDLHMNNMCHTHTHTHDLNSINLRNTHQSESLLKHFICDSDPVHQDYSVSLPLCFRYGVAR